MRKILKNNKLHIVNEALYSELHKHNIICENNELDVILEAGKKQDELFDIYKGTISGLLQRYNLNDTFNQYLKFTKQSQDDVLTYLAQKFDELSQSSNGSVSIEQQQEFINNVAEKMKQKMEQGEQSSQEAEPEQAQEEPEQPDDNEEKDNTETKKVAPQVQSFLSDKDASYIKIMQKFQMLDDIIREANKIGNTDYTLETMPKDIFYQAAENYVPFRNKLLNVRLINGLKNSNLPKEMKQDILDLYKSDEKRRGSLRNILSSPQLKEKNQNQGVYDFPVTEYYINKYSKNFSKNIYKRLANIIHSYLNSEQNNNEGIDEIVAKLDVSKENSPEEIQEKIKSSYPQDVVDYLMKYNELGDEAKPINDLSDEDLVNMFQGSRFKTYQEIDRLFRNISNILYNAGLIPFIDYLNTKNGYTLDKLSNNTEPFVVAKYRFFADLSVPTIMSKITNRPELKDTWEMEIPAREISLFYDEMYKIKFTSKEIENLIFAIDFTKGFTWLNSIKKSFEKGQRAGKNWKGFIK